MAAAYLMGMDGRKFGGKFCLHSINDSVCCQAWNQAILKSSTASICSSEEE